MKLSSHKTMNMCYIALILAICLTSAVALPQRIAGGEVVEIERYPFAAVLLRAADNINFRQNCAGTIINNRSVLTAASCWFGGYLNQIRIRVGSAKANSGGTLHSTNNFLRHGTFNTWNHDNNIAIIRSTTVFPLGSSVRPATISAAVIADNIAVTTVGWGQYQLNGPHSEVLRRVQILTLSQARCQTAYGQNFFTANMMCAGWLDGGRGSCPGDFGGPLLSGSTVVGITSFGAACGDPFFPIIYTRVGRYTAWITQNA